MKLLLTSGGLRNTTLVTEALALVGVPANEIKVAFISTAMNVEPGDKGWAIAQLVRLQDMGIGQLDIIDVSAVPEEVWLPRIQESNVIFVNGGNTTYLVQQCNKSGFSKRLPELLKERLYIGSSAGSYLVCPDIRFNSDNKPNSKGLGFVDFGLQVHYKSPDFPIARSYDAVAERVKGCPYTVYALDDQMAVRVVDGVAQVVGEGEHIVFEPTDLQ